eukprot:CAMPEP_0119049646 /NCGR_PEP_ID=MMETSP1177-20130426/65715_1 /TAXON_ID=2985 /ORGANISM="Ochromonas sp, Strain CCMP1899" /LENGTH=418 /DNA_ID=CAMNT_0007027139 /DNA_START=83 /DNA_END=1336 /DNA_ORIENTATION=-
MDSDNDENLNSKDKGKVKACKKFSIALIRQAVTSGWEDHEIANLLLLIYKELELDNLKLLKFLQKCNVCTPIVLQCLVDSDINFSSSQIITAMFDQTDDTDSFIKAIGVSFEQELLDATDDETLEAMFDVAQQYMNGQQFARFTHVICDQSKTKSLCGKVLNVFTRQMTASEATAFICDIVEFDFFMDLSGKMKGFYKKLVEVGEEVKLMLQATKTMDEKGNIVESDADDQGDLRDFIDNDDEVITKGKSYKNMNKPDVGGGDNSDNDGSGDDGDESDGGDVTSNSDSSGNESSEEEHKDYEGKDSEDDDADSPHDDESTRGSCTRNDRTGRTGSSSSKKDKRKALKSSYMGGRYGDIEDSRKRKKNDDKDMWDDDDSNKRSENRKRGGIDDDSDIRSDSDAFTEKPPVSRRRKNGDD